jgi:hypothetical protein
MSSPGLWRCKGTAEKTELAGFSSLDWRLQLDVGHCSIPVTMIVLADRPARRESVAMTNSETVIWLEDASRKDVPRVGGKNASLGEMLNQLGSRGLRSRPVSPRRRKPIGASSTPMT